MNLNDSQQAMSFNDSQQGRKTQKACKFSTRKSGYCKHYKIYPSPLYDCLDCVGYKPKTKGERK